MSKKIDNLLEMASLREDEIPEKVERRIIETLNSPKKKRNKVAEIAKKLFVIIVSGLTVAVSSVGVYAAMGGEIAGRPAFEFFGVKTSANIDDYKEKVEGQEIGYKDTKVELVSSVCSEGITTLEFNVKLSKEDKENLLIGQPVVRQEDYDNFNKYYGEGSDEYKNFDFQEYGTDEETYNKSRQIALEEAQKRLKNKEEMKYTVGLALNTNQVIGKYSPDKWNQDLDVYGSIYIDGQGYYCKNWQKTEKISEYEYRIYQMYLITDNELNQKENFTISLKNNVLVNLERPRNNDNNEISEWVGNSQSFIFSPSDEYYQEKRLRKIDLSGDFEVQVSKEKVMSDSRVIDGLDLKPSVLGNIKVEVEKVTVTPLQTIIKLKHSASHQTTSIVRNKDDGIEWMPMTSYFDIRDENGEKINNMGISNWNTLIFEDGTTKTYDSHDIPQDEIENATYETVVYIVLENTETSKISITPMEHVSDNVYTQMDQYNSNERVFAMDEITIDL